MKSLNHISIAQSAKLLHQLFPDEIPAFLRFLKEECEKEEIAFTSYWDDDVYTSYELNDAKTAILDIFKEYGYRLEKSRKIFSEILFQEICVMSVVIDRLLMFITTDLCTNLKFNLMAAILFIEGDYLAEISARIDINDVPI